MLGGYLVYAILPLVNNFYAAVFFGVLVSLVFGLVLEKFLFKYFYKRDHLDQVLLTFGLIYIFEELRSLLWGDEVHGVAIPPSLEGSFALTENLSYPYYRVFISVLCTLFMLGLFSLINKTTIGMKIRAGAFNRQMTESLGIDINKIYTFIFALGVALASLAGMISAPISSLYPNMGSQVLIMCFVVVVIGGIGSVKGALIAALLVGLVDTFGKVLVPEYSSMLVYVLMAFVLLFKPQGLFER